MFKLSNLVLETVNGGHGRHKDKKKKKAKCKAKHAKCVKRCTKNQPEGTNCVLFCDSKVNCKK